MRNIVILSCVPPLPESFLIGSFLFYGAAEAGLGQRARVLKLLSYETLTLWNSCVMRLLRYETYVTRLLRYETLTLRDSYVTRLLRYETLMLRDSYVTRHLRYETLMLRDSYVMKLLRYETPTALYFMKLLR
jgi:hypothetical protein